MPDFMLTTEDNPYDPFTQFDQWFVFDESKGYCTCGYIARLAKTSDSLPESMNLYEINRAMDEIIKINGDFYKKVEQKEETESKKYQKINEKF